MQHNATTSRTVRVDNDVVDLNLLYLPLTARDLCSSYLAIWTRVDEHLL